MSSTPSPRKAALASWIGSAVEYYDFFIYGTAAALVLGKIFFPSIDPKAGMMAAFATFGVGYITRPLGALLLGARTCAPTRVLHELHAVGHAGRTDSGHAGLHAHLGAA